MKQLGKWMLGAAVMAGTMALGATTAHAQVGFGVYVGNGPAYVPPCPGPGYQWVAGYYSDGYWVPGRWAYVGTSYYGGGGYGVYYRDRDWDRDRWRDHERHEWREHEEREHGDWDRHDNGWHRGWDHDRR